MKYLLALATTATLAITGCSGETSSDSSGAGEYPELMKSAKVVQSQDDMASCNADSINSLYFVRSTNGFSTCVDKGGAEGHGYVPVNTERTQYDGAEQVLSFNSADRLPWCGWWRRGLVAYVSSSKELKYCGKKSGYFWWYVWKNVDLPNNGTSGSSCTVVDNGNGTRTITCGDSSIEVKDGKDGVNGADGIVGDPGAAGADGIKGDKGDTGAQGPQGPQGPQGEAGPKGSDGDAGPQGPQGLPGGQGASGPQGPAGPAGPQGPNGDNGAAGPVGPQGPQGTQGDTGPQGPRGPKGDTGPAGTAGSAGSNGTNGQDGVGCTLTDNGNGTHTLQCGSSAPLIISSP